jgi:hypothetical protein
VYKRMYTLHPLRKPLHPLFHGLATGYGFAGLLLLAAVPVCVEELGMLEKHAALRIFWWTLKPVSSRLPNVCLGYRKKLYLFQKWRIK